MGIRRLDVAPTKADIDEANAAIEAGLKVRGQGYGVPQENRVPTVEVVPNKPNNLPQDTTQWLEGTEAPAQ